MDANRYDATLDQLHPMLQWIRERLHPLNLDPSTATKIELASEEVLVNIIHHTYHDEGGEIDIQVEVTPQKELKISFLDKGLPFNPLQFPSLPEEEKIGGLGIVLIRKCVDTLVYQRKNDRNVLTLVFLHR